MCRILYAQNLDSALSKAQIRGWISYLIRTNGGHGSGYAFRKDGNLYAMKSRDWNEEDAAADTLSTIAEASDDRRVLWHTRVKSSGGVTVKYNHPVTFHEYKTNIWSKHNSIWTASEADGFLVHNGTWSEFNAVRASILATQWKKLRKILTLDEIRQLRDFSDTQFLAFLVGLTGNTYYLDTIGDFGTAVVLTKKNSYVVKNSSRTLYLFSWDENTWAVASSMSPLSYEEIPDIYMIPNGVSTIKDVLRYSLKMTAQERKDAFTIKTHQRGTYQTGYYYSNNWEDDEKTHRGRDFLGGETNKNTQQGQIIHLTGGPKKEETEKEKSDDKDDDVTYTNPQKCIHCQAIMDRSDIQYVFGGRFVCIFCNQLSLLNGQSTWLPGWSET